ncbi:MAG: DUF2784 domain-containing protein [Deltaproteobacteria bacterium]|nr:MAG: DUF2784 domain-containing protein [Deltaproteobacteria bacterium]
MAYRLLADFVVVIHLAFIIFVVLGGLLVIRWPRLMWIHIPAASWGALIEFAGWICPLTPLENWLRFRSGMAGYAGGFIERYILPVLYPLNLTREIQFVMGAVVILVNFIAYGILFIRCRSKHKKLK